MHKFSQTIQKRQINIHFKTILTKEASKSTILVILIICSFLQITKDEISKIKALILQHQNSISFIQSFFKPLKRKVL